MDSKNTGRYSYASVFVLVKGLRNSENTWPPILQTLHPRFSKKIPILCPWPAFAIPQAELPT